MDVDKQMQIIENLIQTGVKVLIVTPSGSKEIAPAIAKANQAGIKVVVVDTRVDPQAAKDAGIHIDTYIGSDNYEGGKIAGRHLVEATGGKATVAILERIPSADETGDQRLRGFKGRHQRTRRGSRSWPPRPRTGSATRASPSSRTCWRPIPTSTPCSPRTT